MSVNDDLRLQDNRQPFDHSGKKQIYTRLKRPRILKLRPKLLERLLGLKGDGVNGAEDLLFGDREARRAAAFEDRLARSVGDLDKRGRPVADGGDDLACAPELQPLFSP